MKGEHALPVTIIATTLFSGLIHFFFFFALFVLFRKSVVSTHKTVDKKAPDQVFPYSNNTFSRNKAANLGHSRTAQPNKSPSLFGALLRGFFSRVSKRSVTRNVFIKQ